MARQEHPREDLLRDATALRERVELRCEQPPEIWIVGFRKCGAASFFRGEDPVIHFNAQGELRRLYLEGLLYKAEQGAWVQLRRQPAAGKSLLLRLPLSQRESQAIVARVTSDLQRLAGQLDASAVHMLRVVPAQVDVRQRVARWLRTRLSEPLTVASRPHVA